ncbi:hypothetical protein MANES_12G017600v8 [Manihot esculenta]|uniref:Response regulatory domain-containing protein n=1 Tax=Manihot esculenta TaxID=3983 RepID=A0A2C9USR2_MANES|nr:hypothetical protein MANES_12G017600v8 [Manihot esculenta]
MDNGFSFQRYDAFRAGLRVLVVDDDPMWLKILEKMLKKCSYEVTTCALAREALHLLQEKKGGYDIVISDVNMPDMDGFELLADVGLEMDLPVIMMSVDGATSRVMKGVQLGACDYLLKPIRMKEIQNIWQHVVRKRIYEPRDIEILEGMETMQMTTNGSDQSDDGHLPCGEDPTSARKRKDVESKHDDEDPRDTSPTKKARVVWSVELHQKFIKAVNQIGFHEAGPRKILDLMNVPWLTREKVASHLQKYRLYLSRLDRVKDLRTCVGGIYYPESPALDSTASAETQYSCNMWHKGVSNASCGFSGDSLSLYYLDPRSYGKSYVSDEEETVSVPVIASKRSLTTYNSNTWKSRSSEPEFSSPSSESEVNFAVFDSTFLFAYSRDDDKNHRNDDEQTSSKNQ